jgi:hypothetical protein
MPCFCQGIGYYAGETARKATGHPRVIASCRRAEQRQQGRCWWECAVVALVARWYTTVGCGNPAIRTKLRRWMTSTDGLPAREMSNLKILLSGTTDAVERRLWACLWC